MEILPTPQGMGTELSMTGLIAITWTGTGVSILFTSARIAIRIVITDSAGSTHLLYSVQYDRARYCRPRTSLHPLRVCDHWNILVRAMERKSLIPSTLLDDIQWVASVPAGLVGHRCVRSLGIYRMLDWVGVHLSPAI
ncbi:hypothetical protein DTO006G1_5520 [Penicillium roqueforti]|uniref:uncharacterized protein n=1 Tax=Penicillium roqueforti TaxID=5082 RepID=UPI00190CA092|nr:uncharacterized protein LCP9604111_9505 [Penicillium roqueforti]KAF9238301.1 hypothetical protein LCP9604111_9505 [Penicillium roqueforti]KAI2748927.1 hypothetical protein DTO013F2_5946 [Penicillium roqueforti]KAI2759615.1 hypothetical protein DTO006G1_5520 [Penicillium roqueforti]KAI3097690.1 hypothetical protein CBS147333_9273 [Penicillium roqueforti]KAI3182653.1 hypothetical protein DTO032C6_7136 [Penicillium roqueforti]